MKSVNGKKQIATDDKLALYHRVMRRENFEKAAKDLFGLLKSAQVKCPNMQRILYVDIDGHKNANGGYDGDMLELQYVLYERKR